MSGDEDAALGDELRRELARLEGADARGVLGLAQRAGADEARAAFHDLAKRFHPSRYARRDREVVRLANEVFLRLRRAHDELVSRAQAAPARPEPPAAAAPAHTGHDRLRAARAARLARQLGFGGEVGAPTPAARPPAPTPAAKPPAEKPPAKKPRPSAFDAMLAEAHANEQQADASVRAALEQLEAGEGVAGARRALHELAASHPHKRAYRAAFHCALAVEHTEARQLAKAKLEVDRALALDDSLELARALKQELAGGARRLLARLKRRS